LWSPDGQWVAYTMARRSDFAELSPGWLFEKGTEDAPLLSGKPATPRAALNYRLWASRAETGESVLLEESRGPLTSPTWSPDGRALAFGRLVPEDEGRARFEVVVQESPDRKRVVLSRAVSEFNARVSELPGLALAWSPDGRYLAIPLFQQTLCLGIIRADNGRILKIIEDAYLPAWSPDGSKLAFVQGSDAETLHYIDHNFGPPRHLADIGQTCQAPVWFRDSRSLAVVARRPGRRREPPSEQTDLLRIQVESGKVDLITTFPSEPGDRDRSFNGSSFSLDREGDELFYVSEPEGHLNEITWYRPRTGETAEKFHPIDHSIRIGALAVSPSGKTLAFRVGSQGDLSTPALVDLTTKQFTPLVPDDAARVEWLSTLIQAARSMLRANLPSSDARNQPIDRPTLLPVPGELPANPDIAGRLRRLGRIGRPLCDRPLDAPPASPALLELLAEARLFFDFLREDYDAAMASLEALEPHLSTRDQRVRLLGVRAQVFLGLKQTDQATKTIEFLQAIDAKPGPRFEQTAAGPAMIDEVAPIRRWPSYLIERTVEINKAASLPGSENPLGHRNPDNPNPNADLIPGPGGAPLPFGPPLQVAPPFLPVFPEFEEQPGAIPNKPVFPPRTPHPPRVQGRAPGR
jgi:Tol biopolymer transport system component